MENIEEVIPTFSMWKSFNETLTNTKYNESNVKKLANVINTEEFSNILLYNHNPTLTFEQNNEINDKYKAFTVWLLGRVFYLLSNEKLAR